MLKTIHSDMYEVDKPIHKMLTHAKLYFMFFQHSSCTYLRKKQWSYHTTYNNHIQGMLH